MVQRILLFFFCLLAGNAFGQADTLEILVLGTSHQNKPGDYTRIIHRLKALQPDMVFGEYLSSADLKDLPLTNDNWISYQPKYHFISTQVSKKQRQDVEGQISKAEAALVRFPYHHQTRMQLAQNLVLNYDRGNAEYQFWVLQNKMKTRFGKGEAAQYKAAFLSEDTLQRLKLIRPTTEYHQIVFPLLFELGQPRLYAMDCQKYDEDWNKAWANADILIKQMEGKAKADTASAAARVVRARNKFYEDTWKKIDEQKMTGYHINNSNLYAEVDAAYNFYGGEKFYGYEAFPTAAIKEMFSFWQLRNEAMCRNVVEQARRQGAKRVIVAVGASHRKIMEDLLATYPKVKLLSYNSLP